MTNKDKIIKDEFSDLRVIILENGWVTLKTDYGDTITLGQYPNARFRILERMFEKVKEK